jgi:hypothetical protein
VNEDRDYGAMPKLYGAPSYSRPRGAGAETPSRPFDPDDLPLEAERSSMDHELVAELAPSYQGAVTAGAQSGSAAGGREGSTMMRGRPLFLRLPGRGKADDAG